MWYSNFTASKHYQQMKIRVHNLPKGTTEQELTELFIPFGNIEFALIPFDAITLQPKRYGMVLMSDAAGAKALAALQAMHYKGNVLRLVAKQDTRTTPQRPQQKPRKRIPYRKP
jgi:RNA recognition motif-containing protein